MRWGEELKNRGGMRWYEGLCGTGSMGRDIELAEQARSNHRAGEVGLYIGIP